MTTISVVIGDITTTGTAAIVNPANAHLAAGGGACGAIFSAAGHRRLAEACKAIGGCPTGTAVATLGFDLAEHGTSHIIHAVGPVWSATAADRCDEQLVSAYRTSLAEAVQLNLDSIAFPAISTGIYGFPISRAARLVAELLASERFDISEIQLVFRDENSADVTRAALHAAGLDFE